MVASITILLEYCDIAVKIKTCNIFLDSILNKNFSYFPRYFRKILLPKMPLLNYLMKLSC